MSDTDDIWAQAIQEAYASAPTSEVVLHTLELRHPSFTDDGGALTAVRVVLDHGEEHEVAGVVTFGHYLTLEDDAPVQAGQSVLFQACAFGVSLPEQREGSLPSLEIELDNVTREIMEHLEGAVGQRAPVEVTYREWLSSDRTAPQFSLGGLTMKSVKSNALRVTGTAQFSDLINRTFPSRVYRPEEFRGLRQ